MNQGNYSLSYVKSSAGYETAMHRFRGANSSKPLLLIHGNMENASIFFSKSGKGLAPYLMNLGFDVFAPDLPGKGKSRPQISRGFNHSQADSIHRDIPNYISEIKKEYPQTSIALGGHSWGGVLLLSWYAFYGSATHISCMFFFGTKRRINVLNWRKVLMVNLFWNSTGKLITAALGYLPTKRLIKGGENEPTEFYLQGADWVNSKKWRDHETGEDISMRLKSKVKPPMMFTTGVKDHYLGNPKDVKLLMEESGVNKDDFVLLSEKNGNLKDYDHIDILTSPNAVKDHFPKIAKWILEK